MNYNMESGEGPRPDNQQQEPPQKQGPNAALVEAIENELQSIDEGNFPLIFNLVQNELFRLRGGVSDTLDIISTRRSKVRAKVDIPVEYYPGINFVGKLLGPGGSTLKNIQEQTNTKMAILGAGSVRNEQKEKELLGTGDPKYQHLRQKLHLQIDSLAPASEAYYKISHALAEVKKAMTPEPHELAAAQGWGMQSMQPMGRGGPGGRGRGMGRGFGPGGPRGGRGGRGRGGYGGGMGGDEYYADPGSYGQTGYEDFNAGAGYEQSDQWMGKMRGAPNGAGGRGGRGRGRGRGGDRGGGGRGGPRGGGGGGHPYSRPPGAGDAIGEGPGPEQEAGGF